MYSLASFVKATERVKGRIHRGQPGPIGQSEKTTIADKPAQVAEDHQDAGKVNTQKLTYIM